MPLPLRLLMRLIGAEPTGAVPVTATIVAAAAASCVWLLNGLMMCSATYGDSETETDALV